MSLMENFKDKVPTESDNEEVKPEDKRVIGKITKVAENEGWGFITSKDVPFTRIFFHWSALLQNTKKFPELKKGMTVEFTPKEVPEKGIRAGKILVIE